MPRRAPKILFISHSALRTGAPIGLLAFIRWLHDSTECTFSILLAAPGPLEAEFRELGPTLTLGKSFLSRTRLGRRCRQFLPRYLWPDNRRARRFFAARGFDVIYSNTITNGALLANFDPIPVPVLTHVHELAFWIDRAGPENLAQVRTRSTRYIAASGAVRDHLVQARQFPSGRISVIYEHIRGLPAVPTPAERASARSALGIPPDAFVVGGCGAEHWRKGRDLIPQLLVALRRLRPQLQIRFLWVGRSGTPEEERGLRSDLAAAGFSTAFHSTGEIENPFRYFPAFDVFALLSRDDPYPLACLEVAATEVPVVCFADAGGIPEFVQDSCGCAVPYLDVEAFASSIVGLADDANRAKRCGQLAREKVARENLVTTTGPRLLAEIERTAAGNTCA
jgi:glycosyltransferase involved in cell wall biosynthesis